VQDHPKTVNARQADYVALALVGAVFVLGLALTWQSYQQWLALGEMGGHMGDGAAAMHGTHPLWYLLGTVVAVALVGGGYLAIRDQFVTDDSSRQLDADATPPADDATSENTTGDATGESTTGDAATVTTGEDATATDGQHDRPSRPLLDVLPEDERRILQPVVDSPGLTQIELRDRADFSKSKVSQTVSDLEKRGLLYREPQGRTYRVYPSDEIEKS